MSAESYVLLRLGAETFGVHVRFVATILPMQAWTHVPGAPSFVEGVINMRGVVVPVVNLRRRLGLPEDETPERPMILVIELDGEYVGLLVDQVETVATLQAEMITPPTGLLSHIENRYILGILSDKDRFIVLLDPSALFTPDQQAALQSARSSHERDDK
ncbi:purine-binding chemotaxis protein CheW [Ardenticatena maritima]|uniref:Purine-binding chemotaxis protein CheW n=1 Tax=Ardenticatena maritima TaxID=872965 RepID=A0A0M8K6T1_9CHLR|nr:chemotaxis protein CheW [Ardenticatena maritima]GAP62955.1 purine-binding chemotaxis protein CheW [Ardenticatena maritima]